MGGEVRAGAHAVTTASEVADVLDALRGYVQLATGLGEVTVAKAREAAAALLSQGIDLDLDKVPDVPGKDTAGAAAKQAQALADDLLEQSKANRELIVGLVRTEVDRTAGRLGFVREEELAAVRRHVARLETQLSDVRARVDATGPGTTSADHAGAPAAAPTAKKKVPVKKKVATAPAAPVQATGAAGSASEDGTDA